jgi:hypothetical protein
MFYGVEQSTDMRCRNTVIKKFTSQKALENWMKTSGGFTYADPESARNWHKTFRRGYEFKGRMDYNHPIFKDFGSPTYPNHRDDQIAYYLSQYAMKHFRPY